MIIFIAFYFLSYKAKQHLQLFFIYLYYVAHSSKNVNVKRRLLAFAVRYALVPVRKQSAETECYALYCEKQLKKQQKCNRWK